MAEADQHRAGWARQRRVASGSSFTHSLDQSTAVTSALSRGPDVRDGNFRSANQVSLNGNLPAHAADPGAGGAWASQPSTGTAWGPFAIETDGLPWMENASMFARNASTSASCTGP